MKNEDIAIIVRQVQKDKEKYFSALFNVTWDTVYYLSLRYLKHPQDAEDVAQEVFMILYDKIDTLQNPIAFNEWMNTITIRSCNNAYKREVGRRAEFSLENPDENGLATINLLADENIEFHPENFTANKDTNEIMLELIDKLPLRQREVVLLYYYREVNTAEIAKIIGRAESTVRNNLHLARNTLKNEVEAWQEKNGVTLHGGVLGFSFLRSALQENAQQVGTTSVKNKLWSNITAKKAVPPKAGFQSSVLLASSVVALVAIATVWASSFFGAGIVPETTTEPKIETGIMNSSETETSETSVELEEKAPQIVSKNESVDGSEFLEMFIQTNHAFRGEQMMFIGKINGQSSSAILWIITGNTSKQTYIGNDGQLHVAPDETATQLSVTARSKNTNAAATIQVYVWQNNGDGTASAKITIVIGNGRPGTNADNALRNPAGDIIHKVLSSDIQMQNGKRVVHLGSGLYLHSGADGKLGTADDLIQNFGRFPQSSTGVQGESLTWRLLNIENGKALLVSDKVLDSVPYSKGSATQWSDSHLRAWLNREFYNTAFNAGEKAKIHSTTVSMAGENYRANVGTSQTSVWQNVQTTASGGTADKVFALSASEVWKYFGKSTNTKYSPQNYTNARANGTAYAKAQGAFINSDGAVYALRSDGCNKNHMAVVHANGSIHAEFGKLSVSVGTRPAIMVVL